MTESSTRGTGGPPRRHACADAAQVLASADVCMSCTSDVATKCLATSLGLHRFKGVLDPVEVFDLR